MLKTAPQVKHPDINLEEDTNPFIPYGRQLISEEDIQSVIEVLKSDYLTTGPKVHEFEQAVAGYVGSKHAIAVSSGTAGLHCAMYALGISPGDEVIVPAITFAATANCVVYQGGIPIFADIDPETLLIDPESVIKKITKKTKAIIAVDYAGQPCDYNQLRDVAGKYNLKLVADSCHAIGAEYNNQHTGTLADMTIFSFHPVKHITTGEGGMITTDNPEYAKQMRSFRNHGISTDHHQRKDKATWFYEMTDLGFNYRITDFQCALGISQLKKLDQFISQRQTLADIYDKLIKEFDGITPLKKNQGLSHAYHLYVVQIDKNKFGVDRDDVFDYLRKQNIGVNVHYIPVHLHPYYRKNFSTTPGQCPNAEKAYREILSLPIHPALHVKDTKHITTLLKAAGQA